MTTHSRINVGLIGAGRMGQHYARYLAYGVPSADLVAISDSDPQALSTCGQKYNISKCYADYQDLITDKQIDAVVIITSTDSHKAICLDAARAGKAIFCEKPLTLSLPDGIEIEQVINESGVFFHMGHMRRFDKGYAAAKQQIEAGEIGEPVLFKSTSRDPFRPSLEYADPQVSGGMFVDMGIHDFDIARWLVGEVESVFSMGIALAYPEMADVGDIDNGMVCLRFESGQLGMVDCSRSAVYGYDIATEIMGTKATVRIGYLQETSLLMMRKNQISHDVVPYFMERFEQAYITQLNDFIDKLQKDEAPSIQCLDGIHSLRIGLAARQSLLDQREVKVAEFSF